MTTRIQRQKSKRNCQSEHSKKQKQNEKTNKTTKQNKKTRGKQPLCKTAILRAESSIGFGAKSHPSPSLIWQILLLKGAWLVIWLGWLAARDYSLHKHFHPLKSSCCGRPTNFPPSFLTPGTTIIRAQGKTACITGIWVLRHDLFSTQNSRFKTKITQR